MSKIADKLKKKASRAYCDYIDQMRKTECLGWEAKIKSGEFGKPEIDAHNRAAELLGKHRAYTDASNILADILVSLWTPIKDELPSGGTEQIYIFHIAINEDAVAYRYDMIVADGDEAADWIQKFNKNNPNEEVIVEWLCQAKPQVKA